MLNSGLLVVNPSLKIFSQIRTAINTPKLVNKYDFPDQGLLSDIYAGRWVPLPYIYNALKTMRWEGIHSTIWRDDCVKVVHYIFANKPWNHLAEPTPDERTNGVHKNGHGRLYHANGHNTNQHTNGNTDSNQFDNSSDRTTYRWWWIENANRRRNEKIKRLNDGF
jgi:lipopolysaccharide biosynthesis glycosyltransferase